MQKTRVFAVLSQPLIGEGIRGTLDKTPDMELVGSAKPEDSLTRARTLSPDVLIIDSTAEAESELLLLIEALVRVNGSPRILILADGADPHFVGEVFRMGALGYFSMRSPPGELASAIRAVASGQIYVDPAAAGMAAAMLLSVKAGAPGHADLSARQIAVLKYVAWGLTDKEIADKLNVSAKSVSTYKKRAIAKLGLTTRADIVRYAVNQNWLAETGVPVARRRRS